MPLEIQPVHLADSFVRLRPLESNDFETLYSVASDPLIWEQHPNPDRYKRDVFMNYFEGAVASGGALIITGVMDNDVIGCTRFYDHSTDEREIKIGYTFFSRKCWGRGYNLATKALMLDHAFAYVDKVIFHVGANNMRSRFAMAKLGARHTGDEVITYYGEQPRLNCVFQITLEGWKVSKETVYRTILEQKQSTSS